MEAENSPNVDVDEIVQRILKIKLGELPPDAVSVEEMRQALAKSRAGYKASGEAVAKSKAAVKGPRTGRLNTDVLDDLFGE